MFRIDAAQLAPAIAEIFLAAGSAQSEAKIVADHLVEANLLGHDSHGVIRVRKYVDWAGAGRSSPTGTPRFVEHRGAAVLIDGGFGYGQVIGKEAMELAAERAAKHGFALVAIRNSGHLGRIGAWPQMLAEPVSSRFISSTRRALAFSSRRMAGGTGGFPPIRLPPELRSQAGRRSSSTSPPPSSPRARSRWREQGREAAAGAVLDGAGRPTIDPAAFYADPPGAILPFGGHKGSGLSFFCEILAGSLTGGFASNPSTHDGGPAGQQHAVDRHRSGGFRRRRFLQADSLASSNGRKASPPIDPGRPVLLPGEIELATRREREAPRHPARQRELGADHRRRSVARCQPARRGWRSQLMSLRPNPVRARLRAGETAYGILAAEFFTPGFCQIAANAGADFVIFDMEHGGVGIDALKAQFAFARGTGIAPLRARAGPRLSSDRARPRRRRHGHHGSDAGNARAGREACRLVPLPAGRPPGSRLWRRP